MENCSSGQLRLLLLLWNWDSRRQSAGQWTPHVATACDLLQLFVLTSTCTDKWAYIDIPLTLCVLYFVSCISLLLMGCCSVLANSITNVWQSHIDLILRDMMSGQIRKNWVSGEIFDVFVNTTLLLLLKQMLIDSRVILIGKSFWYQIVQYTVYSLVLIQDFLKRRLETRYVFLK